MQARHVWSNQSEEDKNLRFARERINRIVQDLQAEIYPERQRLENWLIREVEGHQWQAGSTMPLRGDGTGRRVPYRDLINTPGTYGYAAQEQAQEGQNGWRRLAADERWGGKRKTFHLQTTYTVPAFADGRELFFHLSTDGEQGWDALNPQFSCYLDGQLVQGIDINHREVRLHEKAVAGEAHTLHIEAYTADREEPIQVTCELYNIDREVQGLYYDLKVPLGVAELLEEDDENRLEILNSLNDAINLIDTRRMGSPEFHNSVKETRAWLEESFYQRLCSTEKKPTIYAVGHTHIDIAWLWTLDVTADKTVRSFSTMLQLMNEYPEFIFMSSQPQLYEFIERYAPQLMLEIERRVKEGLWEVEGAMYVEADCNISSGEGLARQLLYGKRYFRERFGYDCQILWLPDVFGYSAALPQLLRQAGVPYFMTTKISWNETNRVPYDTFQWEGIDGTTVLTHFAPPREYVRPGEKRSWFTTYNSMLNPTQTLGAWQRFQQKDVSNEILMTYGWGDGGGGTTKKMLETARRLKRGIPGAPVIKQAKALDFFQAIDEHVGQNPRLPRWIGELYLEYHRGTYTSMARNKKSNRRGELGLQSLEFLASLAAIECNERYPYDLLSEAWEIVLRNQFHDILPGSSIFEVYEDSRDEYARVEALIHEGAEQALRALAKAYGVGEGSILLANASDTGAPQLYELPAEIQDYSAVMAHGQRYELQRLGNGRLAFVAEMEPYSLEQFELIQDEAVEAVEEEVEAEGYELENEQMKLSFAANGELASIYDKRAERELLKPGQLGNRLVIYEDRPHNYENWDINNYYTEKSWPVDSLASFRLVESGPYAQAVEIKRPCLDSEIVQIVRLNAISGTVDFETKIDWKNHNLLLKALFPLAIHAHEANFEIQYGSVKRSLVRNTSWDEARFEVVMHKWLDFAEYGYGVSFLNDCKYGCHVFDGEVGLTLLKSGTYPNPTTDQEQHQFCYSLFPHQGSWQEAGTLEKAYQLNQKPFCHIAQGEVGEAVSGPASFVSSSNPAVHIEVFKQAEDQEADGSAAYILRAYEAFGGQAPTTFYFTREVKSAEPVNLLEESAPEVDTEGGLQDAHELEATFKPFQIRSWKLKF